MYQNIMDKIDSYQNIVIHRHKNPDLDALGSQLGLKGMIELNFNNKQVKAVGDTNEFSFIGSMDHVEDNFYEGALVIVLDVSVSHLVSDTRYKLAKEVIIIDHHLNKSDFADTLFSYPEHIATCQIITDLCMKHNLKLDALSATQLFSGLVTDSGRFYYPATSSVTFHAAGFLVEQGADIQFVYNNLYIEDLNTKKLKGHFINNFQTTPHQVAYMKNNKELKDAYRVSTFKISRGMVNQMAGISGISIWANFTEDDENLIQCELRSKSIPIVHIAKKYGGGGHALACGCTVKSWEETDEILKDLDQLLEGDKIDGR
jgi:bifunctional oligoribonuclease and PAP phosphatase NrnA